MLYAGFFCASVLILFGVMYWVGAGFISDQIDQTAAAEVAEVRTAAHGGSLAALRGTVTAYSANASRGMYYLLLDAKGAKLAGNIAPLAPVLGVRIWAARDEGGSFNGTPHEVRGLGVAAPEGGYLFVGLDAYELEEMREMISRSFLVGILATIVLALGSGSILSVGLLRRVETISQTSRDIIAGDLSRRIPVRATNDEFDHLAASLNAMLDRIETLMAGLQEVSTDIAHDLRTPLTRHRQRLELARAGNSLADVRLALDRSIEDVDSILDTFTALLRITQIEAHTRATAFATIDLSAMLNDMAETYASVAEEQGQTLATNVAGGLLIMGDRELLPQLFSNLIENAIRHCPAGTVITVAAAATPGHGVVVEITDTGPGIPADMRTKVFQRFFRLERSRTTEGTGLGLSLCAAIAALHNAVILLSDNHPGLKVTLRFQTANQTV
ncbi:MAG: HAMP domain-containing histidine kinase [Alphaproteobacteria bacterium]|nr:HAMP domain-containing histidine kinase [Alphaproteobacteria bacterium]MBL7097141.1 HAMP domain-containing histidine kinase [Alphaproteobacteria bacterium]